MTKTWDWLRTNRKLLAISIVTVASLLALYVYKLGSLTGGLAPTEQFLQPLHVLVRELWNNPLNLPVLLSRMVVAIVSPNGGKTVSRLPGVLLGIATILLFYWLLRRWYGWRVALFGGVMLTVSPWLLHTARFADTAIVYPFSLTVMLVSYVLYHQHPTRKIYFYLAALVATLLIYVPGVIWLLIVPIVLERDAVLDSLEGLNKKQKLAMLVSFLIVVTPLTHALVVSPSLYKPLLGLPIGHWPTALTFLKNIGRAPLYIFVRGPIDPSNQLGRLPLLNSFSTVMFLVGLYLYGKYIKSGRTRLLASLTLLALILYAIQGPVALSLLMPIVFIVTSGGVGYLLHQWLKVFPKNPLARGFGIGLLAVTLLFSAGYNIRQYFIAWPHNSPTQATFRRQN